MKFNYIPFALIIYMVKTTIVSSPIKTRYSILFSLASRELGFFSIALAVEI